MLKELINFTKKIDKQILLDNLSLKQGLHVLVKLDNNSKLVNSDCIYFGKNGFDNLSDDKYKLAKICARLEQYIKMINNDTHKCLDTKPIQGKWKIHSCNPFCVSFKKKELNNVQNRFAGYFENAFEVCCDNLDEEIIIAQYFKCFCEYSIINFLRDIKIKSKDNRGTEKEIKITDLKESDYITIYLENATEQQYDNVYNKYLTKYLYLKDNFNFPKDSYDYGLSSFLNGLNDKKIFLQHKTATFSINGRITKDDALSLHYFYQLRSNKLLPNPLPIFIEEDELNNIILQIFSADRDRNIKYSEIIKRIYETRQDDLHNYYLLNFQMGEVKDFDFVSLFRYNIADMKIEQIFPTYFQNDYSITTIFDFELKIVSKIFNNRLVQISDKGIHLKYFDDIEYNPKYITMPIYNMILKYRKAFYDYIYKSKIQSINRLIFKDIMMTGILDDIKNDKIEKEYHTKESSIKEKLNIFFSINHHFDEFNKNFNKNIMGAYMPSRINELKNRLIEIIQKNDEHFNNDEEFAYGAGQLILYLLYQSEASNKSHALLEPFLQKSQCNLLLDTITRTFNQYKHNISFSGRKFNRLANEVLGYKTDINLKLLTPILLSGYFSNNIILDTSIKI